MAAMQLTRTHRILIGVVVTGAVIIAGIGFAGSYAAVRELAEKKGFGDFAVVFPIGIDAGICVLLALDLLLTWMRIPFPMLRQTAWLLTVATIAFNGAASWPDPLGVGMHAVIPVLFVVTVEAARHAVGRIADITADKHMDGVRITRWLLSPIPTFKLWRRMKLWELRSYEQVIKLEQERLVYRARLQGRYGRGWRRKAPVEAMMPLRLAKFGVPLAQTAPAGLAAAGVDPVLLPPAPEPPAPPVPPVPAVQPAVRELPAELPQGAQGPGQQPELPPAPERAEPAVPDARGPVQLQKQAPRQRPEQEQEQAPRQRQEPAYEELWPEEHWPEESWAEERWPEEEWPEPPYEEHPYEEHPDFPDEPGDPQGDRRGPHAGPGRPGQAPGNPWFAEPQQKTYEGGYDPAFEAAEAAAAGVQEQLPEVVEPVAVPEAPVAPEPAPEPVARPSKRVLRRERKEQEEEFVEAAYPVFVQLAQELGDYPKVEQLDIHLSDVHGVTHAGSAALLRQAMPSFKERFQAELMDEHIA
ncbi:DUF2637 domain-containing protein [Streptomyces yaizuensis]|uniref:DUF2637 domain-containing protein n=1 Tax=Streptomyces yaizuensis TaxID=2989713 RepID=A0ABQ5P4C9_9ACTN|nr:DUF2637 domain-containing protein [Streptomyces sp. YSPA8]GLF97420.1 DUF2637 domain-containing protein [Streptomyces sp. YSPA8]